MRLAQLLDRFLGEEDDALPQCKREVPWRYFLDRLALYDEDNVLDVISRLTTLSRQQRLPLAVMAVGSTLYKGLDRYNDIDLLVLPLNESDLARTETILVRSIVRQPEIRRSRRSDKVAEGKWEDLHCYNRNRYWTLDFAEGKPVQLFIATDRLRRTLRGQIEMEIYATGDWGRPYSILRLDC